MSGISVRNIASAIGIVCVDYFSFSGIFISTVPIGFFFFLIRHIGLATLCVQIV